MLNTIMMSWQQNSRETGLVLSRYRHEEIGVGAIAIPKELVASLAAGLTQDRELSASRAGRGVLKDPRIAGTMEDFRQISPPTSAPRGLWTLAG